jgi:hypothetical protein
MISPIPIDANGKRYLPWADVDHVILNRGPLSIVVLGSDKAWQCYVLVHMFGVSYSRKNNPWQIETRSG